MTNTPNQESTSESPQSYGLTDLLEIFKDEYDSFYKQGFYNLYLGNEKRRGIFRNVNNAIAVKTGKTGLWDSSLRAPGSIRDEKDLFDIIKFLYDNIGFETASGYRYAKWWFNALLGKKDHLMYDFLSQVKYRRRIYHRRINEILRHYKEGKFVFTEDGFVEAKLSDDMRTLLEEDYSISEEIHSKIDKAIRDFKRPSNGTDDRHDAVRTLADIFESLKNNKAFKINKSDERAIFNIANNFAIRHNNKSQKTDYDKGIWLEWIFYFYLCTLNMMLKTARLDRAKKQSTSPFIHKRLH